MLKRFLLVIACISLLFVSPVFADELEAKQNLPVMDEESINSSIQKAGLKSVNLNPGYDEISSAGFTWNLNSGSHKLAPNETSDGFKALITIVPNDITQNNKVVFYYSGQYGSLNGYYVTKRGSFDDIIIDNNIITIFNPHNTQDSGVDLVIEFGTDEPFTNFTDNDIDFYILGNIGVISSGTELYDILSDNLNISMVIEVLATTVTVCIGFIFMWWGIRKTSGAIMSAFRRGKLRI